MAHRRCGWLLVATMAFPCDFGSQVPQQVSGSQAEGGNGNVSAATGGSPLDASAAPLFPPHPWAQRAGRVTAVAKNMDESRLREHFLQKGDEITPFSGS